MTIRVLTGSQSGTPREELLEGRPHLVVPVVALVVGVHAGSGGPVFYSAEQLAAFAVAWNGEPVTLRHPRIDNQYVSANSPEALERFGIGRVFGTSFSDNKLRAELWIDIAKAEALIPTVLDSLRAGNMMEVSTGLFSDCDNIPGIWNGEQYTGSVMNIRPDHIALLPDETGACSIADGCGVRANENKVAKKEKRMGIKLNRLYKAMKRATLFENEISLDEVRSQVYDFVNALDTSEYINYVVEILGGHFIYQVVRRQAEGDVAAPISVMYRRSYSVAEADGVTKVTVADDPTQVQQKTEYVPVASVPAVPPPGPAANDETKNNTNKEVEVNRKEIIDNIIACSCTPYAEADRAGLEKLDDAMLNKVEEQRLKTLEIKNAQPSAPPVAPPAPAANAAPAISEEDKLALTEFKASKAEFEAFKANQATKKAELVKNLLAAKVPFEEAELNAKQIPELEKIATLAKVGGGQTYAGAAGAPHDNQRASAMPSVWEEKK